MRSWRTFQSSLLKLMTGRAFICLFVDFMHLKDKGVFLFVYKEMY